MEAAAYIIFAFLLTFYVLFMAGVCIGIKKLSNRNFNSIPDEYISIIIPFRNESENILKNLKSISEQDYPKDHFEVIYINDCSDDDSYEKICSADKPDNIRVLSYKNGDPCASHKKQAVQFGIEKSKGEIIITTDCDCIYGKHWLRSLLSCYDDNTAFISGPVSFTNDGSVFQQIQALEFGGLILIGAGLIGLRKPVICNAANLSFRKKAFYELQGYSDNLHLSSGDDEFLMRKIAAQTNYKINFCFSKEAVVSTLPNVNVGQFYHQRKRWASKSLYYKKFLLITLFVIFLFFLGLPLQLFLGLFVSAGYLICLLGSLFLKTVLDYIILSKGRKIIFDTLSIKFLLIAELFHAPYILVAAISGAFGNFEWKNRKLKR